MPATFAILAVRKSTPDRYVTEILQDLYADENLSREILPFEDAAAWKDLNYHKAAHEFFSEAGHQVNVEEN